MSPSMVSIIVLAVLAGGCDNRAEIERITRLEKQNEDLKQKISQRDATADFDLSAKCSNDAKVDLV